MNFTTVVSLRGLPAEAEYGLTSIFYFIFAAVVALSMPAICAPSWRLKATRFPPESTTAAFIFQSRFLASASAAATSRGKSQ